MKSITLLKAITSIDDTYVEDALAYRSPKKQIFKQLTAFASVAACVCIVLFGTFFAINYFKYPTPTIPKSDFIIENGMLVAYTGSATEITLPDEVNSIAPNAFAASENAENITTITLNSSIKNIDEKAFEGVVSLNNVNIPDNNENFIFTDGVLMATDGSINFSLSPEGDIDVDKFINTIHIMEKNVDFIGKRTTFVFGELTIVAQNFISERDENDTYFVIETFTVFGQTFNLYDSKYDSSFSSGLIGENVKYTLLLTDEVFLYSKTVSDVGYYLIITEDSIYEYEDTKVILPDSEEAKNNPTWYNDRVYRYYIDDNDRLCYINQPRKYLESQEFFQQIRYCVALDELAWEEGFVTIEKGSPVHHFEKSYTAGEIYDIEGIFNDWYTWVTTDENVTDDYFILNGIPKVTSLDELLYYNSRHYVKVFNLYDDLNLPFRLAGMTFAEIEAEFGTMKYEYLIAGGIPVYSLDSCPDILIRFTKVTGISDDGMPRATGNDLPNRIELNSGKVYPGVAVGMNAEEVQALVPDLDPQSGTFSLSEIAGAYPTCYSRDGFNIIVRWKFPDETFYELENNMWDGNTAQDYWETHEFNGTVISFDVIKIK